MKVAARLGAISTRTCKYGLIVALACLPTGSFRPLMAPPAQHQDIVKRGLSTLQEPTQALVLANGSGNRPSDNNVVKSYSFSVRGVHGDTASCSMNTRLLSERSEERKARMLEVTAACDAINKQNTLLLTQLSEESDKTLLTVTKLVDLFRGKGSAKTAEPENFPSKSHAGLTEHADATTISKAVPGKWALAQVEMLHAKLAQVSASPSKDPSKHAPAHDQERAEDASHFSFSGPDAAAAHVLPGIVHHNGFTPRDAENKEEATYTRNGLPSYEGQPVRDNDLSLKRALSSMSHEYQPANGNILAKAPRTNGDHKLATHKVELAETSTDEGRKPLRSMSASLSMFAFSPSQAATSSAHPPGSVPPAKGENVAQTHQPEWSGSAAHTGKAPAAPPSLKAVSRQRGMLDLVHEDAKDAQDVHEHFLAKSDEHHVGTSFEQWCTNLDALNSSHV
jgi:hypothetical protein